MEHGVENHEQFAHAGGERRFGVFPTRTQLSVKILDDRIGTKTKEATFVYVSRNRALARLAVMLVVLLGLTSCNINAVPQRDEKVKAAWSEVLNQYQRRSDLIPNLIETVKGYAHQEQQVLMEVTNARTSAMKMQVQLPPDILTNPAAFQQFEQKQAALGGALTRLMAVSESYPDLKSSQNFLALQSQLEGTENRIAVARRDYIEAVQNYNLALRTIPDRWIAAWLYPDAKLKATFTISEQSQQLPQVKF